VDTVHECDRQTDGQTDRITITDTVQTASHGKKKKQFEIVEKIAQISLPWQQVKIQRTTFCSFCHGELMAKKWLDSIEKQRKRIDLKERYRHTYRQTSR